MRNSTSILKAFFFIIGTVVFGCGSDDSTEPPTLSDLNLSSSDGNRLDLFTEETTTLSAGGLDQFGNNIDLPSAIEWSVDNNNVSIDADGKVTALAVGSSIITAKVEDVEDTYEIDVWDSSAPRTDIYVSDVGVNRNGPHQILRYDSNGDHGEVFISTGLSRPQDIVFLEDQELVLISNFGSGTITQYDISTGESRGVFAGGLNGPTRLEIGPDNLLYVLQWNSGPVKRYNLDGTFVDDFTSSSVSEAIGIDWDADGNVYVSSFNNGSNGFVKKFDASGEDLGLFITSNLSGPTDIWFDNSGNLLVNDWSGNRVQKFDSNGAFLSTFITGVTQPEGVAFFDNGDVLIGDSGTGAVKRYSSQGTFIEDIVAGGAAGLVTTNAVVLRKVNQ
eukprot:Plantae.Rhodophyta-Purpureofilum_apyrenoidigerum.ctg6087.p1 GENE.Plantae.Rhodophyta-Purpureofilum_apyrenoidigerum.ctg6087~~Plantae.Rhodophyta-Purpureofilum_apyrenoidigerum.ctg6087.p1  ORF type:complete len:389 (+),score=41.21 Plantae.Rhodophyta-Purpureofilum_apyrenoidigerum.ctg6087:2790-3956(+)